MDDFEGGNFYWGEWPEDGDPASPVRIQGSKVNMSMILDGKHWYIDSDRYTYVYLNQEFKFYDPDFTSVEYGSDAMQGLYWQITETEAGTYLCGSEGEQFVIWDARNGRQIFSSNAFGNMTSDGKVVFAPNREAYLCEPLSLTRFSLVDDSWEYILGFEDEGYSVSQVYAGAVREDGTLMVLVKAGGEVRLLEIPEEAVKGAGEKVEVAMTYASSLLRELVVDFNKNNPDYQIVLRLPGTDESEEDFRNRIMAEINGGGGQELLAGNLLDMDEAVHKGYLRDMTDFCAQDRDRIWETAWENGRVDGRNYMIPYKCVLWTLVTGEKLAGQQTTWNLSRLEQRLEEAGCDAVLGSIDQGILGNESVFYYTGIFSKSRSGLIDWESGTSRLNGDASVRLMEFLKQHTNTGRLEEQGQMIADGELPIVLADLYSLHSLQILAALFQDREVYIGFPSEPEEMNCFLSCDGFVVNQAGGKAEGAEAFLSYLLSQQTQQKIARRSCEGMASDGLAVDKKMMDWFCEYARRGEYVDPDLTQIGSFNGYEYENMVLTEESVEKFRTAFESAGAMPDTGIVYSIVGDEAPAYFSGNKSAKEVADIIHNRVQLYLDEKD